MRAIIVLCALLLPAAASAQTAYESAITTVTRLNRGALRIDVLVDAARLGGNEVELAEITFPANLPGAAHRHGTNELLYILRGELEHIVNGRATRLSPGMIGIVRRGDEVTHRVPGNESVRVLAIWAPGGEAARLTSGAGTPAALRTLAQELDELRGLRESWSAAYNAGELARLTDMYTSNATRMPYDLPAQSSRDSIMSAYARSFGTRSYTPHIVLTAQQIEVRGDLAVERGAYDEVLTLKNRATLRERGKYVSLLRRGNDGKWRYEWSIFNRDAPPR